MIGYIRKGLFYLFYKKRFGNDSPYKRFRFLLQSQYWDRDTLKNFQLDRANDVITYANSFSKFYKERFAIDQVELKQVTELKHQLPVLLKQDVKSHARSICSIEPMKSYKHETSGSMGIPISINVSKSASSDRFARIMRFLSWWDVKIDDRNILIWGSKTKHLSRKVRVKNWIKNRLFIPAMELNDENVSAICSRIKRFQPKYIRGYTSSIMQLATLVDRHQLEWELQDLKVIVVTSVMLYEEDRVYMEKILKCRVANEYGAAEFGVIGCECQSGSMHISEESLYVDVENEGGIMITDLINHAFPIINYAIEDRVVLSDAVCSCGRTSRVISSIEGRLAEVIRCPDGSEKGQVLLYYLMKALQNQYGEDSIEQYKFSQKGFHFTVEIVPGDGMSQELLERLEKSMYENISKEITVEILLVQEIPLEESGKLRFFKYEE